MRPLNGPAPGVAPGAAPFITGSAAPDAWNNPARYPPDQAGNSATSILPHWMMAAVEAVRTAMRPKVFKTDARAQFAPQQGFASNAVNLPGGIPIPYGASPQQYNRFLAGTQFPGYGASMNVMLSTTISDMNNQPAFQINGPLGQGRQINNLFEGLNGFAGARPGLPTFFPVGNRSLQSSAGTGVDSHPVGVSYLVIPPDRYRRPNRAQPVRGRSGFSRGNISLSGTNPLYFGS